MKNSIFLNCMTIAINVDSRFIRERCSDKRLSGYATWVKLLARTLYISLQQPRKHLKRWDTPFLSSNRRVVEQLSRRLNQIGPERKLPFRQNPNIEYRNSKQYRISNFSMFKTKASVFGCLEHLNILIYNLFRISQFGFLISKFKN